MPIRRNVRPRTEPESKIQKAIIDMLKIRDWSVKETHGNLYQSGFPDLYAYHAIDGTRWIEVKVPDKYKFTPAQLLTFPDFAAKNVGIWILTAATDAEYAKLFKPANWHWFLDVMKPGARLRI